MIKLQQDVIAAVAPFTIESGTSAAFVTTPDDPIINPALIDYVAAFVPKSSGEHFNPHVTTGVAPRNLLDKMLAEPLEKFTFPPAGAAVYQLGQFGTASKKLKEYGILSPKLASTSNTRAAVASTQTILGCLINLPAFGTWGFRTATIATRQLSPGAFCTAVQNRFESGRKHRKM